MQNKLNENAGNLSERVTVSREVKTDDGMGGGSINRTVQNTFWAAVAPLSGRERDMAAQTESPRNYRFIMRRTSQTAAIKASDILTWRDKKFNIRFIADAGPRPLYISIDAEEGVAE